MAVAQQLLLAALLHMQLPCALLLPLLCPAAAECEPGAISREQAKPSSYSTSHSANHHDDRGSIQSLQPGEGACDEAAEPVSAGNMAVTAFLTRG